MAQFDVYPNPNPSVAADMPYVIDVQADFLVDLPTRILVPLARSQTFRPSPPLNPTIRVGDEDLVLLTNHLVSLPSNVLRQPVASLEKRRYDILNALDFLFTGI